jgi:hypothetical protein
VIHFVPIKQVDKLLMLLLADYKGFDVTARADLNAERQSGHSRFPMGHPRVEISFKMRIGKPIGYLEPEQGAKINAALPDRGAACLAFLKEIGNRAA